MYTNPNRRKPGVWGFLTDTLPGFFLLLVVIFTLVFFAAVHYEFSRFIPVGVIIAIALVRWLTYKK